MNFSTRELAIIWCIMNTLGLKEIEVPKEFVVDSNTPGLVIINDTEKDIYKIKLKEK